LSGPGYLIFWMLAPLGLTLLCSVVALLTRSAGGMMLMLGCAAGLLVLWGADELVQTDSFPPVVYVHHGTWVAILIALSVSILAAVAALLVPWDRADDARPRGVALTPVIVLIAAIVFVTLLVTHHNSAEGIRLAAPSHLRQLAWPFSQPAMPAT
jgi:hypothetical protein